jgi:hypothetical protein
MSESGYSYHHYSWYSLVCQRKKEIFIILRLDSQTNVRVSSMSLQDQLHQKT